MEVQCPNWGAVRHAYAGASRRRVLRETWGIMPLAVRFIFVLSLIVFIVFLCGWVSLRTWPPFLGMVSGEFLLVWIFLETNDRLLVEKYAFSASTPPPVGRKDHQLTRYLAFKKELAVENVSQEEMRSCIELIDQLIGMTKVKSGAIRVLGLAVPILTGAAGTVIASSGLQEITTVLMGLTLVFMFLWLVFELIPSQHERHEEWRYFSLLYVKGV